MHGSVRGMGNVGIFLQGNTHRVENVYVTQNGRLGIHVGAQSIVRGSSIILNGTIVSGTTGIDADGGSSITNNDDRAGLQINRVLRFVSQMRMAVFHLGDLRCGFSAWGRRDDTGC